MSNSIEDGKVSGVEMVKSSTQILFSKPKSSGQPTKIKELSKSR